MCLVSTLLVHWLVWLWTQKVHTHFLLWCKVGRLLGVPCSWSDLCELYLRTTEVPLMPLSCIFLVLPASLISLTQCSRSSCVWWSQEAHISDCCHIGGANLSMDYSCSSEWMVNGVGTLWPSHAAIPVLCLNGPKCLGIDLTWFQFVSTYPEKDHKWIQSLLVNL